MTRSRILNISKTYLCEKINGGFLVACKDDLDVTYELVFSDAEFKRSVELFCESIALG